MNMNEKEIYELINQLREYFKSEHKDKTDEEIDRIILNMFISMHRDDKMSKEDLITLSIALGYELDEEKIESIKKK